MKLKTRGERMSSHLVPGSWIHEQQKPAMYKYNAMRQLNLAPKNWAYFWPILYAKKKLCIQHEIAMYLVITSKKNFLKKQAELSEIRYECPVTENYPTLQYSIPLQSTTLT
jgi:hypothetical protein